MSPIQAWAKWTIVAAGVLFSPPFAFLLALAAAYFVVVIKGTGVPASSPSLVSVSSLSCWSARVAAPPDGMPIDLAKTLSRAVEADG